MYNGKQSWLSEFLELPNGIPSDDTFRRVFERINPEVLAKVLSQWLPHLIGSLSGEIVPIDGKSLRGSYDRNQGIKALHLVTAWAGEQKLVLGQVKVEDKSNEITAIPALLELLDLQGAIITLDAMGTQTAIINHIQAKKVVINALFGPSLLISNCRVAQSLRFKLLTSILSCPWTKSIATSLVFVFRG